MRRLFGVAAAAIGLGAAASGWAAAPPALTVVEQWAGPDGGWDFSSFDAAHRRLYVARTNGVTAVDVDSGRMTPLLAGKRTHEAIAINGGAEVLVTDASTGSALIADAMSGAIRTSIPTGKKPDAAMVEPATGLAMVFDNAGGGITLIDPKSGQAVGVIAATGALESPAADGAGKVFINVEDLNEIEVVDVKARTVVAHWPLAGCESPSGLAYAPKARLLVSACANKTAKVVSADTGEGLATLAIGGRPDWAAYDERTATVLIPTGQDGVVNLVSVDSPQTVKVVGKVAGHVGSRSGALDEASGRLYLPSADFTPVPGGRPTQVAGSFKVLVLGGAH